MIINKTEILPGETKDIQVNIARLPSKNRINITINVARAKEPGPVLLLLGGLHGDEINGIEIVRRIREMGYNIPEKGTFVSIPIINIFGFIHSSRYVPDGKDVNRSFPGNKNGSLASRVAYFLRSEILPQIDVGLDFHTGGADRTNYPQIRCMMKDSENEKLANIFNAPFTIHSKYRTNSLRRTAANLKKKILVYEGGESSRFDEFAIERGIIGALNVMNHLELQTKFPIVNDGNTLLINKSTWIRAKVSGLLQSLVKSGQKVAKN